MRVDPSYQALNISHAHAFSACLPAQIGSPCILGLLMHASNESDLFPPSNQTALFEQWKTRLDTQLPIGVTSRVYNSSSSIETAFASNPRFVAGLAVTFANYPSFVEYDIRMPSLLLSGPITPEKKSSVEFNYGNLLGGAENFASSGFNALQVLAEETLGNTLASEMGADAFPSTPVSSPTTPVYGSSYASSFKLQVSAARAPYADLDNFKWIQQAPIFLMLSFMGVVGLMNGQITKERLSGQLSYWRVMGLSTRAYWLAHAVDVTISLVPGIFLVVAWTGIIGFWGPAILYAIAYIVLFVACTIPMTLLIGAISPDEGLTSLFNVIYFILPLLASALVGAPQPARLAFCILAPFNFLFGAIEVLKRRAISIMGETEAMPAALAGIPNMDPMITIGFFFLDMALYWGLAVLAIYLRHRGANAVPPSSSPLGDVALSKQRALSSPPRAEDSDADAIVSLDGALSDAEDAAHSSFKLRAVSPVRESFAGSNTVLSASNLFISTKNSETPKLLVDSLQIEAGIYALIGLGRSELISCLCDTSRPESGSLQILGYDMYRQKRELLGHVSICPKTDLFLGSLSGLSHVELIARLSSTHPLDDVTYRVRSVIEELGLAGIAQQAVEFYSSGEKRLLMLACALVVPARVVILDDLSSGMNHDQRKLAWKALMKRRTEDNVTFVLTSEHMEEVEMIAERIGVMHNGNLIREGSLEFLLRQIESLPRSSGAGSTESAPSSTTLDLAEDLELAQEALSTDPTTGHRGLKGYFDHLKTCLDPSVEVHNSRATSPSPPLTRQERNYYPQQASAMQQFKQLWRLQIMGRLRNRAVLNAFVLVPIILSIIAMSSSRGTSATLEQIPTVVSKLQATTLPVSVSTVSDFHASIPIDGPPSFTNLILKPWLGANVSVEQYVGSDGLNGALWGAKGHRYPEGGIFVQDTASSAFSYSVAYNRTEVYSTSRLINWMNNAAFSYYMTTLQGIPAPNSSLAAPFLRLRSVPFPNRFGETVNSMPGLHYVTELIAPSTINFTFQLVLAMAIITCIAGMQLVVERENGTFGMLRRAGVTLPAYWSHTFLLNLARHMFSGMLMVSASASYAFDFLRGPAMLIYSVSLVMTTVSFMMLGMIIYRSNNRLTIIRGVMHLHVVLSVIPGMFSQLGPVAFGQIGWLHWLGDVIKYIYYIYPTAIFPEMVPRIAYIYADAGFKHPSFSALFSGPHSLTAPFSAIFLHLLAIFVLFIILEYLSSWTSKESEKPVTMPNFHSPENPMPNISGGLPAYTPLDQSDDDQRRMSQETDLESGSMIELGVSGCETRSLRRRHNGMPRAVVESLTIAVPYGSSYALVGPPRCGKTTVLRIMSGEEPASDGDAFLAGRYVCGTYQAELFGSSRLCSVIEPDCFNRFMTPRETIRLFLAMRNDLSQLDLEGRTTFILERALLTADADTMLDTLGMNVKRVLAAAIATLTYNEVIMMDEPTKDCDFATRKMVLSLIADAINEKHAAVLITSSVLDEAAQLCAHVGLMVNGQLACQGRLLELEAACSGYELRISFSERSTEAFGISEYMKPSSLLAHIESDLLRELVPRLHRLDLDESCARGMASCATYDLPASTDAESTKLALDKAVADGKLISFKFFKTNLAAVAARLANQQLDDYSRVVPKEGCSSICK